jgi:hypothetical protein
MSTAAALKEVGQYPLELLHGRLLAHRNIAEALRHSYINRRS